MTRALKITYQQLEKAGWDLWIDNGTTIVATPPEGESWSTAKAHVWDLMKHNLGAYAKVTEKDDCFELEDEFGIDMR